MAATPDKAIFSGADLTAGKLFNLARKNASPQFRAEVPAYEQKGDFPDIGGVITSNPGILNEFYSALMNQIGKIFVHTRHYTNPFRMLEKEPLEYGEIVEEIAVAPAELRDFSPEKAHYRELKQNPADVRTAFHMINFEGQYKTTILDRYIKRAFTSESSFMGLVERVIASLSQGFEADDYGLHLYSYTKRFLSGGTKQIVTDWDDTDPSQSAKNLSKAIRTTVRKMDGMSSEYNSEGMLTTSSNLEKFVIIDAETEAEMNVEVLATVFNIDRAQINERIIVIPSWDSVNEERFDAYRDAVGNMPRYTEEELEFLRSGKLKALVFDIDFSQVRLAGYPEFRTKEVVDGSYMNHVLTIAKIYATSPLANAVAVVEEEWSPLPDNIDFTVTGVTVNDWDNTTVTIETDTPMSYEFDNNVISNLRQTLTVVSPGVIAGPTGSTATLSFIADGRRYTTPAVGIDTLTQGDTVSFAVTEEDPNEGEDPIEEGEEPEA